jgi:hypothetical protein
MRWDAMQSTKHTTHTTTQTTTQASDDSTTQGMHRDTHIAGEGDHV